MSVTQRILEHLEIVGRASAAEIAEALEVSPNRAVADCCRLMRPSPGGRVPKRIHIVGWVHEHLGARRYPRPVYELGDGPDREKPRMTRARKLERQRRYYHDRAGRSITSVWDLVLTTTERGLCGRKT